MKREIYLALLFMAGAGTSAHGQTSTPLCGATNYDQYRSAYTIVKPTRETMYQQCFITIYPRGVPIPASLQQVPASAFVEGS